MNKLTDIQIDSTQRVHYAQSTLRGEYSKQRAFYAGRRMDSCCVLHHHSLFWGGDFPQQGASTQQTFPLNWGSKNARIYSPADINISTVR